MGHPGHGALPSPDSGTGAVTKVEHPCPVDIQDSVKTGTIPI